MYCTAVPKCRPYINMLGVGTCCFKEHLISKFCKSKVGVRHTQSQPPASISSTSSPTLADPEWLATAGAAWFAWRMGGAIRRFLVGVERSGFLVESSLKIDSSSEIRYISVKERHRTKESTLKISNLNQYCQNRSVNILTRVCREFTRLSRSKHTLVNILTIDPSQYSDYAILVWFGFH